MNVRHFMRHVRALPAGERAQAAGELARALLHSPLGAADRHAMEAAATLLLDDPSPLVRQTLAMALAASPHAPAALIHALAHDQPDIAMIVLAQSPLLDDAELVERLIDPDWRVHCAIACRLAISAGVSGMLAEVAGPDACEALLDNPGAVLEAGIAMRILERHGGQPRIRAAILARGDLPAAARQAAVAALSGALAAFVAGQGWLTAAHAGRLAAETREKATVTLAGREGVQAQPDLVRHLRDSGQLTAGLLLRALLAGNVAMLEAAMANLAGCPPAQAAGLIHACGSGRGESGFQALYGRAGMPEAAYPAFRAALTVWHECGDERRARLSRRMTERVLTSLARLPEAETRQLLVMLRRFAAEAARDEARAEEEWAEEERAEEACVMDEDQKSGQQARQESGGESRQASGDKGADPVARHASLAA